MLLLLLLLQTIAVCSGETTGYLAFLRSNGKQYQTHAELKLRLGLFRRSVKMIEDSNAQNLPYKLSINKFSDMTDDELAQYRGLNITIEPSSSVAPFRPNQDDSQVPESMDWISKGYVTPAKDQGRCGSCWAFGSTVALEGAYKGASGTLRNFAEQEYLDCVFTNRDGCTGGAIHRCFEYSQTTGHMAAQKNYPYTATDISREKCDLTKYKNSLVSAKVSGRTTIQHGVTEELVIQNLAVRPLSLVIEATRTLYAYSEGILMDRTCWADTNHAVAGVGYTPQYIVVKNSWGADWGESGFFKVLRGWRNCGLYTRIHYPTMSTTGQAEIDEEDKASSYDHSAIVGPDPPKPDPDCSNMWGDAYCNRLSFSSCHAEQTRDILCRKKCGNCWIE